MGALHGMITGAATKQKRPVLGQKPKRRGESPKGKCGQRRRNGLTHGLRGAGTNYSWRQAANDTVAGKPAVERRQITGGGDLTRGRGWDRFRNRQRTGSVVYGHSVSLMAPPPFWELPFPSPQGNPQ